MGWQTPQAVVDRIKKEYPVGCRVELVLGGVVAGLEAVARLLRLERGVDAVLELLDGLDCRLVHSCVPFWFNCLVGLMVWMVW